MNDERRRRGPRPAEAPAALPEVVRRVLTIVADLGGDGVPTTAIARVLGGHPNRARSPLARLVAAGLLRRGPVADAGVGRPAHGYTVTERGRQALGPGQPEVLGLIGAFAAHLEGTEHPAAEARRVGRLWAAATTRDAASPATPAALLAETMTAAGFDPEPVPEGLLLRRCPLLALADCHPEVICTVHQGLVDGTLAATGHDAEPQLVPFARDDGCLLKLDA